MSEFMREVKELQKKLEELPKTDPVLLAEAQEFKRQYYLESIQMILEEIGINDD